MDNEKREEVTTTTTVGTTVVNRISWGAVIAGLVVALVTQLVLTILGIGIGAGVVDFRMADQDTGQSLGIGAVIWFAITALISLFAGGYVAGRLAGLPRRQDACLHGILTWSAQTLVTFLLLTTGVGTFIGGMANVLGRNLSFQGQNISEVLPKGIGGASAAIEKMTGRGQSAPGWSAIEKDAKMLPQAQGANEQEFQQALRGMFQRPADQPADQSKREALVAAVSSYSGKPQPDAEQQVAQWEQMQQQAQAVQASPAVPTEQEARQAADSTAKGLSIAALATFGMLVLGAFAAAWGGASGRPQGFLTETAVVA